MRRAVCFACLSFVLTFALIACSRPTPATASPDLSRAEWLVLGPFPNPTAQGCPGFDRDFLAEVGGEPAAHPSAGQQTAGLAWDRVTASNGRVDFLSVFPGATQTVAYAFTRVQCAHAGVFALRFGSDDGIKVWCNGALVWDEHVHRAMQPDSDAVRLTLREGSNALLVKVDQGTGSWEFAMGLGAVAAEESEWKSVARPGLKLIVPRQSFTRAADAACVVATRPAYAVAIPVVVSVMDMAGAVVATAQGVTGDRVALPLPAAAHGVYTVRARGAEAPLAKVDAEAPLFIGDVAAEAAAAARRARGMRAPAPQPAETLALLADQLEGKLPASLGSVERNVRAMAEIDQIGAVLAKGAWTPGAVRGLQQKGYRSSIDGSVQPWSLYLPRSFDAARRYSLVVALHGYGDNDYNAAATLAPDCPEDFIIAAPYGRGDIGYRSIGEQDVLDVMDMVMADYPVDPDRVSLVGWSMGGMGTWRIGQFYADRFAAIAPFCGWSGTGFLSNLARTPLLVVHGNADPTVSVSMDRLSVKALRALKAPVTYEEIPGAGHDAWGAWLAVHKEDRLFRWLSGFRRNPWPDSIDIVVPYPRYGRSFWLRVQEMASAPQPGRVTASVESSRRVKIATSGVSALSVDLRHPKLSQSGAVTVSVDGSDLSVSAGQQAVTLARDAGGRWAVASPAPAGVVRHEGGGVDDLFTGPLLIVYGTVRSVRGEVLKRAADAVADWSPTGRIPVGSTIGRFPVKADRDVTGEDLAQNNLLLLGGPDENRLSGRQLDSASIAHAGSQSTVQGQSLAGPGLLVVTPSAWAPDRLACVAIFPQDTYNLEGTVYQAVVGLRAYNVDPSATGPIFSSDVGAFTDPGALYGMAPAWTGWFDRNWKNLRPASKGK